jgi:hypothetical protein
LPYYPEERCRVIRSFHDVKDERREFEPVLTHSFLAVASFEIPLTCTREEAAGRDLLNKDLYIFVAARYQGMAYG